jgi:hypothetical protein
MNANKVFALFDKWKDTRQPVRANCFFRGSARPASIMVRVHGYVVVVSNPTIVISADNDGSNLEMNLRDCTFKSGENVVASAPSEVTVEAGLTDMLEIDFPTGEECIVAAYRAVN